MKLILIPNEYYSATISTSNNVTFIINSNGSIHVSGKPTDVTTHVLISENSKSMLLEQGRQYTLGKSPTDDIRIVINFYDSLDNIVNTVFSDSRTTTFTVPNDATYMKLYIRVSGDNVLDAIVYPILELGSAAHDFVPYHFGGAEDATKLNGFTVQEIANGTNLLINPNFAVNSSGIEEWITDGTPDTNNKYLADGWVCYSGKSTTLAKYSVANNTITGELCRHSVKSNETLTRIALKYYGSKKLWPYLVKHNKLARPDALGKGMDISIPMLEPVE